MIGNNLSKGGFSRPRGPEKDNGRESVRLDSPS